MEYLTIKNTDLVVSRMCMGGCPLGGHGWGSTSESELFAAVGKAFDVGINFFDTADVYGLGRSEQILADGLGANRSKAVIACKFGVRIDKGRTFYDNSRAWMEESLIGSLRRLKTDYIDLYQVHYRDNNTPMEELIDSLELVKKKGYIRYYGLSNVYYKDKQEISAYKNGFVAFQDEYSLANRSNEQDIFRLAQELNLTPMTWGSLGQGILTGKYDANVKFGADDRRSREIYVNFHGDKLKKNMLIVECLRSISATTGYKPSALAMRFILDYVPGSIVLVGAKRPSHIVDNVNALGWQLSKEHMEKLLEVSS